MGSVMGWTAADLPDLSDQTWLITGATAGLGLATARAASAHGARLVLGVRNPHRGAALARKLGRADVVDLDLSSFVSVRRAAERIGEVDVVINNAGVSPERRELSEDGWELHLAVNLLGPFLLTNLLLERVRRRVVIVSSLAHRMGGFDFDDPNYEHREWKKIPAYSQSKLGGMLWGAELARRLRAAGAAADAQLSHPGWAATSIGNPLKAGLARRALNPIMDRIALTTEQGAATTLYAATQPLPSGSLIGPSRLWQFRGAPAVVSRGRAASDPELARRVWACAAEATGSDWPG